MHRSFCFVLALVFAVSGACHYTRYTSWADPRAMAEAAGVAIPPTIDDLAWLAGAWVGEGLGGRVEAIWSPPAGGIMVGHFRLVRDRRIDFCELMSLGPIDDAGTLGLRVRRFSTDLSGWEAGAETVTFRVEGMIGNEVRMDGAVLRRLAEDRMEIARVRDPDGSGQQEVSRYRRVDP